MSLGSGEEERGWPIWRPLGGVAAAAVALIVVLLLLGQCGGSNARANPLCAPDAVPEKTVDARREQATATREALREQGREPTARALGSGADTSLTATRATPNTAPSVAAPGSPAAPSATVLPPTPAVPEGGADLAAALAAADGSQAPFFTQNDPLWGGEEYDHSITAPNGCPGPNMANCGCALTSVTNVMAADGVEVMPDGEELNPSSVNAWASADAQQLSDGSIVSRGFSPGGNVNWNMALAISGGARTYAAGNGLPEQPLVGLAFVGGAGKEQVTADLAEGRPVILSTPRQSHWFTAQGLDAGGTWLFWDPFYKEQIRKGNDFGPTSIHYESDRPEAGAVRRSVVISTRAKGLKVRDRQGMLLPVVKRVSWEDPTCENEGAPDFDLNQVYLPVDEEDVTIEVEDDGPTAVVIHDYGSDGSVKITVHESEGDQTPTYGGGGRTPQASSSPTATPTATVTPEASPTPSPLAPPVTVPPPPSPVPPTPTATPDPPRPPANIALTAMPATAILCDDKDYAIIRAVVTDAGGKLVVDGTEVTWSVALGTVSLASPSTVNGIATSRVTPASSATTGVTVVVTAGQVQSSIRVNCRDTMPPVFGPSPPTADPMEIYETEGPTPCGDPSASWIRVVVFDAASVTATYNAGGQRRRTTLMREAPNSTVFVGWIGSFPYATVIPPTTFIWIGFNFTATDQADNQAFYSAPALLKLNNCTPFSGE